MDVTTRTNLSAHNDNNKMWFGKENPNPQFHVMSRMALLVAVVFFTEYGIFWSFYSFLYSKKWIDEVGQCAGAINNNPIRMSVSQFITI